MFDEDPRANLRICLAMAPQYCTACNDFHLSRTIGRASGGARKSGIDFDGDDLVQLVAEGLRLRRDAGAPRTVTIAGAADTSILHHVLDAAMRVGGEAFARSLDITVVDLCETPLEMCRVYAARHGLALKTVRSDIGSYAPAGTCGLVVMHGVLPFFPADRRLDYMRRIVGWLDSRGLVVSSSQIAETPGDSPVDQITRRWAALEAFLAGEGSDLEVDRRAMRTRLERAITVRRSYPQVFEDESALQVFYTGAGLSLIDRHVVDTGEGGESKRYKQRAVVLGRVA